MQKETLNIIKAAEHELFLNQITVQKINHQISLTDFLHTIDINNHPNLQKLNNLIPDCRIINMCGQPVLQITKL